MARKKNPDEIVHLHAHLGPKAGPKRGANDAH